MPVAHPLAKMEVHAQSLLVDLLAPALSDGPGRLVKQVSLRER